MLQFFTDKDQKLYEIIESDILGIKTDQKQNLLIVLINSWPSLKIINSLIFNTSLSYILLKGIKYDINKITFGKRYIDLEDNIIGDLIIFNLR